MIHLCKLKVDETGLLIGHDGTMCNLRSNDDKPMEIVRNTDMVDCVDCLRGMARIANAYSISIGMGLL